MTIHRADKSERLYKRVCMDFATDPRLSCEACGVMAYLLSKSDDWRIIPQDIAKQKRIGRDKVYRILDELQAAGYLTRTHLRNERGRVIRVDYALSEVSQLPDFQEVVPLPDLPEVENKEVVKPLLPDLPDPVFRTLPKEEIYLQKRERAADAAPAPASPPASPARTPTPPVSRTPLAPAEVEQPRLVDAEMPDPVDIYRTVAEVSKPNKAQREAIRARVTGYVEVWREVCALFRSSGWNVRNVPNMLDRYDKHVAERRKVEAREAASRANRAAPPPDEPPCPPERAREILRAFRAAPESDISAWFTDTPQAAPAAAA